MTLSIPEKFHDLFNRPILCVLTTINPDGHPHSVPVWIEIQGPVGELIDEAHGARQHINKLSEKYTGDPVYQAYGRSGIQRQMFVIEADKINGI